MEARQVLDDCRYALSALRPDLKDQEFRVGWAAAVSLLRAVGHVLSKVDGKRSDAAARAIDEEWKQLRKEPIYEFIEGERNSILKEYDFGLSESWHIRAGFSGSTVTHSYRVHEDSVRLLRTAIDRWSALLDAVELRVEFESSPPGTPQ